LTQSAKDTFKTSMGWSKILYKRGESLLY